MQPIEAQQLQSQIPNPILSRGSARQRASELLAEYFVLTTKDLADLMPEFSERHVLRALTALASDGTATSLRRYDVNIEAGKATHFWGLTKRGVRVAEASGIATGATKTIDEHSVHMLDHEILITRFHVRLKHLLGDNILWRQADLRRHGLNPDAQFDIERDSGIHHFYLEMERSKFGSYKHGEPQIVRKLGNYYESYDENEHAKHWGFRKFRVITVERDKRTHARTLMDMLQEKYPHRMFWLTTESRFLANIGGNIFATPKADTFSFLDL
jgi:hypothetical protein